MIFYPIIFEPIYKRRIWGGDRLSKLFGRVPGSADAGESWDISCRPGDMGTVRYGRLRGTTFEQLIGIDPAGFLGTKLCGQGNFPLLIKLIDANDDLSVQVHPGTGDKAKNEVWYVIHADEGARINAGLIPGTTKADLATALKMGTVEKYLNFIPVTAGDVINIRAGTVHAIGAGLVLAEIQQNSDTTYRVYDYRRVDKDGCPRELHVKEALEVIDFNADCRVSHGDIMTEHYAIQQYSVETSITESSDPDRFHIFTCVDGGCEIRAGGYSATVAAGDSVFIPAALGEYTIAGKAKLLKSFVPPERSNA
jgi:mannose-6-phosphate isomerase